MSSTLVVRDRLGHRDSYQEQRQALALLIAVGHKFFEDRSINLASRLLSGRFSVIPLLLAFVTLLGYFLPPASPVRC